MIKRKFLVSVSIVTIITLGVLKNHVSDFFTTPIVALFSYWNVKYDTLLQNMSFLATDGSIDSQLGVVVYFLLYLLMHVFLIGILFSDHPEINIMLKKLLVYSVTLMVFAIILLKFFGLVYMGDFVHVIFNVLVGKPLVLFLVEGGGLLYQYVEIYYQGSDQI